MSIQCKGQSLWKFIIDISLDVNTQKCRQRVNKICVPFWSSRLDLTITKGKEITALHMILYDLSPLSTYDCFWAPRIIWVFWAAKGLALLRYKKDFLPDKSIKIGLQKPAQISVHKCVQKLACKSTKIGRSYKMGRVDEYTVSKSNFFEDLALGRKVFVNRKTSSLFMIQWWSLLLSLNCLVHYNVWMKLWQLSVSL